MPDLLPQTALTFVYIVDAAHFHGNIVAIGIHQQPVAAFPPLQPAHNGPSPTNMDQGQGDRFSRVFGDAMVVELIIGTLWHLGPMQPALLPLAIKRDSELHPRGVGVHRQTNDGSIFKFQDRAEAQHWMHLSQAGQVQVHTCATRPAPLAQVETPCAD